MTHMASKSSSGGMSSPSSSSTAVHSMPSSLRKFTQTAGMLAIDVLKHEQTHATKLPQSRTGTLVGQ